ncbi:hypothetical protein CPT03_12055 [Pedobacter ginsengisoli]|uniref:Uncharacterized protein n=1 Tax=Pedobacter ginsengisoli TaxID=363852 RepID=A0A2D1U6B5_9SPHI|nr:hypothetical protein [Pedobacter ginsengisoli]ATP57150.1 hypothetical protein CPT03_12055 [Pedobacter ginsengisoli]
MGIFKANDVLSHGQQWYIYVQNYGMRMLKAGDVIKFLRASNEKYANPIEDKKFQQHFNAFLSLMRVVYAFKVLSFRKDG